MALETHADPPATAAQPAPMRNRFDRHEWAGALGDLGTLLPFVIAYLGVLQVDPCGMLFAFGIAMIATGTWYRTPLPVQPMKAIGAVATRQAAQTLVITPAIVQAAALSTGLIWLLLAATGIAQRLGRWVQAPVAQGVMLGLGAAFVLQGLKLMAGQWALAAAGLALFIALARQRRIPAIFALLLLGIGWTAWRQPALFAGISGPALRLPAWGWPAIGWHDLVVGTLFLALPQLPLTLGNAIVGVTAENNRLFPDRPVNERGVATSTGLMNLFGSAVGGIPMCHGAGGLAGHVAFGARTGGSLVILGGLLLALALFFSGSVLELFGLVPAAVLGTILVVTGWQLGAGQLLGQRGERGAREWSLMLVTAVLSIWNVALGFGAGLLLQLLWRRPAR